MAAENVIMALIESSPKPMGIQEISDNTEYSIIYVRNIVKSLLARNFLERVDTRQPYLYKPFTGKDVEAEKKRKQILGTKRELLSGKSESALIQLIQSKPKNEWKRSADTLKSVARAIEELELEGKLIETL